MSEEAPAATETATATTTESSSPSYKPKKIDADKPIYFKHWVRPRTSQYSYLYDYRRNYYDDIIDYLDRRKVGVRREVPRPQTWAERALRTYTQKLGETENAIRARHDTDLIHSVQHSRVLHTVHTKLSSISSSSRRFTTAYY